MNSYQDWNVVVLKNPQLAKKTQSKTSFQNSHENKIANSDDLSHPTVGISLGKQISMARIAKGFVTQKQLAEKLMCSPSIVSSYESGKAIPDNKILQKLRRILNVKLTV